MGPVFGIRNEKNALVGASVFVGVKNIKANACCVRALSNGVGVGENLGSKTRSGGSSAVFPPCTINGIINARNAAPRMAKRMPQPCTFLSIAVCASTLD